MVDGEPAGNNSTIMTDEIERKRQEILLSHQYRDPDSPSEKAILDLLSKELLSTPWAKQTFSDVRGELVSYYRECLDRIDGSDYIHNRTQELLTRIEERTKARIVSGQENIEKIKNGSPVFLVSNHLGLFKLATINPSTELGLRGLSGIKNMYPLPLFHASAMPVARALGNNLYIAAYQFPHEIGEIQAKAGGVIIRHEDEAALFEGKQGIPLLVERTQNLINEHPNMALSIFPEGRSSGRTTGRSCYDLEEFRSGSFVIASKLGLPIIPVPQYFNSETGFEIGVLEPILISSDLSKEEYKKIASDTQVSMQTWLDERRKA